MLESRSVDICFIQVRRLGENQLGWLKGKQQIRNERNLWEGTILPKKSAEKVNDITYYEGIDSMDYYFSDLSLYPTKQLRL